jgi:hypothetical protein
MARARPRAKIAIGIKTRLNPLKPKGTLMLLNLTGLADKALD